MKKRIPVGIDDFDKLIRKNYYFADKSLFIKAILEEDADTLLIPRPRRFGKSLNMSMLKYFLTNKNSEKNRELFKGLNIEQEAIIMEQQGKYPVIYISFKDIKELSFEKCLEKTQSIIKGLFREFIYLIEKADQFDKEDFISIAGGKANQSDYENSLKLLTNLLYKYHGVKPILLIDEYDQPIIASHINCYLKAGINFFRNLLSGVLKDNEALEKGVLTGIMRIAKESIFSGLNKVTVDTLINNRFNYFGLSEDEVVAIVKHYGLDYELDAVKEWYNGYTFGKDLLYNPWSIINFVYADQLKPYWINTSSNDLIRESLSNISKSNYKELYNLIQGNDIEIEIEDNLSFETIDSASTIWNLMLFSGYLTIKAEYQVKIVNKEVRDFFISAFKTLAGRDRGEFSKLLKAIIIKDMSTFKGLLQEIFLNAVSYYDVGKEEKYYHNLMLGFVFGLADTYIIKSNREYGTGRVDLLLKSKEGTLPDYIFEFKVSKKREDLEKDAQYAYAQIKEKQYGIEVDNPVCIGISFFKKEMCLVDKP